MNGVTLVSASTLDKDLALNGTSNIEAATKVGESVAKRAVEKGVKEVVLIAVVTYTMAVLKL